MQMLHPFHGTIQQYEQELSDPRRSRPGRCPLCQASDPLRAHGFYCRTLVEVQYEGSIRVRRYLCLLCKRTVSLLPEFALPYVRFSIQVIGMFLVARLLRKRTLEKAAEAASQPEMPYQRGQFWVRRFHRQAPPLCAALASVTSVMPARDFLTRALQMLEAIGWIPAHCFLLSKLRFHLLGWPPSLVPHGCRFQLLPDLSSS